MENIKERLKKFVFNRKSYYLFHLEKFSKEVLTNYPKKVINLRRKEKKREEKPII